MPRTKEQRAEYDKKRYEKNKEKIAKQKEEYRENNKEKIQKQKQIWYQLNKESIFKQKKEYLKTPKGKRSRLISGWKTKGIKCNNYDMLYNNYLSETHCDFCRVKFGKKGDGTGTFKTADHDHKTGLFRNFLCQKCNVKRG